MTDRIEEQAKMAYEAHGADEPPPGVFPWSGLPAHEKAAWCRSTASLYAAIMTEAAGVAGETAARMMLIKEPCDCKEDARSSGKKYRQEGAWATATALLAKAKEIAP
jgi:hypothetical protein